MADSHAKHHDYHLVDPSPWPVLASLSAFVMAVGAIAWMKTTSGGVFGVKGPWLFAAGSAAIIAVAYMWWRDVVREAHKGDHTPVVQLHLRYGMILFIASEVMFFVAWFWAYFDASFYPAGVEALQNSKQIVGQVDRNALTGGVWPPKPGEGFKSTFDPWGLPLVNTLILLLSGVTVTWAHHALLKNDRRGLVLGLICTVLLGGLFTCLQAYEYGHAAFSYSGHIYGATFFMATGFHGAHVLIGTIFLAVCFVRALKGHFSVEQHFGFEAAAWYWHFVDVVWLFLFAAIYVWGAGAHAGGH
ncbi:MAG: cytochrome c oxidase subunit 3 [Hyphomicrobium sp.]|nr:cytochrome c oxidase subunit 3 [Hyphomicrobium sp.]PPC82550.1 MAG: cytochrome c oxidase subunit 3 [Hyphomicrobium sp.]